MSLVTRSMDLWPIKAREILKAKKISLHKLKNFFSEVVFPWDKTYNNYRVLFQLQLQELPLFIVVFHHKKETIKLLDFLAKSKLTVRIINGRHTSSIQNPDIYADISYLSKICLNKTLKVGGGVTQGQVYNFLKGTGAHHVSGKLFHGKISMLMHKKLLSLTKEEEEAFPGGSAGTVGVVGVTTSGGLGSFKRTLGLAVDSVKSFKIAIPPTKEYGSKIIKVSKKDNLFWALQGGLASNFGIVVEAEFDLAELGEVIIYSVNLPDFSKAAEILDLWQEISPTLSNQWNEDIGLFHFQEELGIGIGGLYALSNKETLEKAKETVLQQLQIWSNKFGATIEIGIESYSNTVETLAARRIKTAFSKFKVFFKVDPVNSEEVVKSLEWAKNQKLPGLQTFSIELMGGAIKNVKSDKTAFYPRSANFMCEIFNRWESELDTCENTIWNNNLFERLYNQKTDNVYVGFPINRLEDHKKAYWGDNKDRLMEIKNKIDPLSVLKFPTGLVQE